MKKLKQSGLIKTLLVIIALLSSFVAIHCGVETISYLDDFSYESTTYTESYQFEQLFLKYAERTAVYVAYLEEGFVPDPNSIYYSSDLLSMLNGTIRGNLRPSESVYTATQESFEYYNRILNYDSECFYYFVENTTTGDFYYHPGFVKLLSKNSSASASPSIRSENDDNSAGVPDIADFETFLQNISTFPAYLVINTQNDRYITNVNKSNYDIINDSSVSWIADFLTSRNQNTDQDNSSYSHLDAVYGNEKIIIPEVESAAELSLESDGDDSLLEEAPQPNCEYIIYTFVLNPDTDGNDEFCKLNKTFTALRAGFDDNVNFTALALLCLVISLVMLCICAGHKKEVEGIYLNSFDQAYTEISLLAICAGIGFTCFSFLHIYQSYELHLYQKHFIYLAYIICFTIGTIGLTSLVKRIKAHVLFKRSLLYLLIQHFYIRMHESHRKLKNYIATFFVNRNAAVRLLIQLFLFALIEIFILLSTYDKLMLCLPLLFITFLILAASLIKTFSDMNHLILGAKKISEGNLNVKIAEHNLSEPSKTIAKSINNIGEGLLHAVDEKLKSERLKAELITNVSHDIKTPLTSIINYVDLLNKEHLENETAKGYLVILTEKAWRLKNLIEDLVEASKASTGAITLNPEHLNITELVKQALGEFDDRLLEKKLESVLSIHEEDIHIYADGHSTYRIIENLLSNVYKYALPNTRVYVDVGKDEKNAIIQIKNISSTRLETSGEELMERFVRGDSSRHSEGNGLGLSIAKSLATLQHGNFEIILDGDLFKAIITLPLYTEE